jgi:hypothetical protein
MLKDFSAFDAGELCDGDSLSSCEQTAMALG